MNILSSLLNWIGTQIGADPSTLTTTSKTIIGSINEINSHAVVEQGTSGNWTYRKWSDGTAECWGTFTFNTGAFSAWGQTYTCQTKFQATYPTGLFSETPLHIVTLESRMSGVLINSSTSTADDATKDHTQSYAVWRGTNTGASNPTVKVYAIGKWK